MSNLDGYVGNAEDGARIARMGKKRAAERAQFEEAQKARNERIQKAGLRTFGTATTEAVEHAFKNETIGLVTKADFMKKRETLQARLEEELQAKAVAEEEATQREKERRRNAQLAGNGRLKLSFAAEEEEEDEEEGGSGAAPPPAWKAKAVGSATAPAAAAAAEPSTSAAASAAAAAAPPASVALAKRLKMGKDPNVRTDFLPDKEREEREVALREQLRREYQATQDAIKAEPLDITYSYWDGAGHRRTIKVKKGDTIGDFLKAVRDQLSTSFKELRGVAVDNLLYIKEDLIMPQHFTFYELIKSKARGKSGPLFDFGVTEDVRIVNDATVEKTDSHAGKIVERHWYERNKHIFPANRWENFDPEKKWEGYTVHDYVEKH
ncbi:hypothetical protein FOA52_005064 [Chlamydomonas sp. UWO 241]|nr:hypothetical protein FOA52_005064 [Chlamydomonas sp. UWO 241]